MITRFTWLLEIATESIQRRHIRTLLNQLLYSQTDARDSAKALLERGDPITVAIAADYASRHAAAMRLLSIDLGRRAATLAAKQFMDHEARKAQP